MRGKRVVAILIGYSSDPGHFTTQDLERLMSYAEDVAGVLEEADAVDPAFRESLLSGDELLHVSRLVTIGELSACFAHEVVNPLMMIRGNLRFIDEMLPQEDPIRSNFDVIDRASRRIEDMAKRMLDFSRKRPTQLESCRLEEVTAEALRFVQPYLRSQLVNTNVNIECGSTFVNIDRWPIVQALINLMQNAADAMAERPHRILDISARLEENAIRIALADTGKGIPLSEVNNVFRPFFTTKGEHGTGLGLYITRRVIEEHGGTITLQTSDRGTTFFISLPVD
jgi:two-component system C4-dicarboxylate transport sensor histidine kinase DctB